MQNFSSNKQAYAFNKKGDKMSILDLPPLFYLDTENDWVRKQLYKVPTLDGMCFIIDWDAREIKSVKFSDE